MSAPHGAIARPKPPRPHPEGLKKRRAVAKALTATRDDRAMSEAERIRACKTKALLFSCQIDGHKPEMLWRGCDSRLCPECQVRLSSRSKKTAEAAIEKMVADGRGFVSHITFTMPAKPGRKLADGSGENWLREIGKLVTTWARRPFVKANVRGVYRRIETTWSADLQSWHPHVHTLTWIAPGAWRKAEKKGLYDFADLRRQMIMEWHALTGCRIDCPDKLASLDSGEGGCTAGGSVGFGKKPTPEDPTTYRAFHTLRHGFTSDMISMLHQVTKYVTKGIWSWKQNSSGSRCFDTSKSAPLAELVLALKGLRLGCGIGELFGVRAPDDDPVPLICETCVQMNHAEPIMPGTGKPLFVRDVAMRYRGPPEKFYLEVERFGPYCSGAWLLRAAAEAFPEFFTSPS